MAKVDYTKIPPSERQKMVRQLAKFLLAIKEEKDMVQVLYRLLTHSEVVMLGRRLEIAEALIQGYSYQSISEKLKVGTTTIRSVDRWLEHAVHDYDLIRTKKRREQLQSEINERARKTSGLALRLPGQWLLAHLLHGR